MKKINFENAEIIKPAKVSIEGIDYEVTPAQLTVIEKYLSAETLNEMQDNIEEASVAVSPTEPTTNEKVWIDNATRKIYVRNDNGVFEEFINVNELKHRDWIIHDTVLEGDVKVTTIPHKFEDIKEFAFRALGTDKGSFTYITLPREFWHNDGTYFINVVVLNQGGSYMGTVQLVCQNKTATSFEIKASTLNATNLVIAYKI